jgi:hypothetical protein
MTAKPLRHSIRALVLVATVAATFCLPPLEAQTQRPAGRGQSPPPARRPAPQRPAAPAPAAPAKPAAAAPAPAPVPPPAPIARDLRFKTVYSTGDQKTESVSYQKDARQRFEFADTVLLKQNDLKRTVQISRAASTYLVVPDGAAGPALPAAPTAAPATPGVVLVTSTFTDTGERKTIFGLQARRVRTTIEREPMPGACDPTKQRIETDAWYVDVPVPAQPAPGAAPVTPAGCVDQIKATHNGDPKALGFPISYAMTMTAGDEKPNVVSMEVTELEVTNLDAALFEIPEGFKEAGDVRALSQALSDANEVKLAETVATTAPPAPKTPGVMRVGVPELTNKTAQRVDTRALRSRLIAELTAAKIEAEPLPAGSQADLLQHAKDRGYDFLLVAEVAELKASKPGRIGGLLKAASSVAGAAPSTDPTEAELSIKLVQPDGKARLSSTPKGKDGGFDMKTGLGIARFAGTMYMNMMTGRLMMNALSSSMAGNFQGMGMLGNPTMFSMQAQGLGLGLGSGPAMGSGLGLPGPSLGLDPTAGAASFLMQQAMSAESLPGMPGQPGGPPSFDAALDEAIRNAAKSVSDNLKKK